MEDKLFCSICSGRIWRHADERRFVDQYFQDRHANCLTALSNRPPNGFSGEKDLSYVERIEQKGGVK